MPSNAIWTHIKQPAHWIIGGIIFINIAGGFSGHEPHLPHETYQIQIYKSETTNASSVSSSYSYLPNSGCSWTITK